MNQQLLVIENLNPVDVFTVGGIGPILAIIEGELSKEVPDTTTAKGRNSIASNAHKVAQSKTLLDKMGKSLADKLNAQLKPINAERKQARDVLDALKERIRQPLNNWEAEEERKKVEAQAKADAEQLAIIVSADQELALLMDESFNHNLEKLEREAKAQALIDFAELEAKQAAHEKQLIEDATAEANRQLIEAEARTKMLAENAEKQRIEALQKAEAEKVQAVKAEAIRRDLAIEQEAKKLQDREDNKQHVSSVRKAAKEALMILGGISEDQARAVVMAIHGGEVPHVKINY